MTVVRRTLEDGNGTKGIGPEKLSYSLRKKRYMYEDFMTGPICWDGEAVTGDGAPAGTTSRANRVFTGNHTLEYYVLGAGQTIVAPVLASEAGYDWGMDQTATEGVEINFGSLKTAHPRVFRVGRDPDFYGRLRFSIEDASGADIFFGVRGGASIQAVQTALATYTDFGGLQAFGDSSSAAAAVNALYNVNDATDATATLLTNTVADGTAVEFEVRVVGRALKVFINGVERPIPVQRFDDGDYMTFVAYILHTTDVAGQIKTLNYEQGLLVDRPKGLLS